MPALPSPGKVIRVNLLLTAGANTRVQDRIFLGYAGAGPTSGDLSTLATTIATAWGNNLSQDQTTSTSLTQLTLTDLASSSGAQVISTTSKAGTVTGNQLLNGVAAVIKFHIARRYRGGHPRFYFGPVPSGDTVNGTQLLGTYAANLALHWSNFINAVATTPPASIGALTHVNVSYFAGFTNKTFPSGRVHPVANLRGTPTVDTILSYSVNPNLGSQRRRNQQSV